MGKTFFTSHICEKKVLRHNRKLFKKIVFKFLYINMTYQIALFTIRETFLGVYQQFFSLQIASSLLNLHSINYLSVSIFVFHWFVVDEMLKIQMNQICWWNENCVNVISAFYYESLSSSFPVFMVCVMLVGFVLFLQTRCTNLHGACQCYMREWCFLWFWF